MENAMTISERIFERLEQLDMTQKELSKRTGIKETAISEWRKKKTNPSSEKIMPICEALNVTPEWLLSGIDAAGSRKDHMDYFIVNKDTEIGKLISCYNELDPSFRERVMGYAQAFNSLREKKNEK
jgi:transcriptional regulator with XRE-family HTH domain